MTKRIKFGFRFLLDGDYVSFHVISRRLTKDQNKKLDDTMEHYGHVGLAFEDAVERNYFDGITEILQERFPGCLLQLDDE